MMTRASGSNIAWKLVSHTAKRTLEFTNTRHHSHTFDANGLQFTACNSLVVPPLRLLKVDDVPDGVEVLQRIDSTWSS